MSMKNVISGFRVCGIHPFNREVLVKPEEKYTSFRPEKLPELSGLKYIPMYSPRRPQSLHTTSCEASTPVKYGASSPDSSTPVHTPLSSMQRSFSESNLHDMSLDQSADESKCLMPFPRASCLRQHLVTPKPPSRAISKRPKSCGRVLTSRENVKELEEKEQKKKALLIQNEERQRLRLEKKLQKQQAETATNPREVVCIIFSSNNGVVCYTGKGRTGAVLPLQTRGQHRLGKGS